MSNTIIETDITINQNAISTDVTQSQNTISAPITFGVAQPPVWGNIGGTLSNQTDLLSALNDKQDNLTAIDSSEIDFTFQSDTLSANLIVGSIDILKLDSGVQLSLSSADTSIQPNDNISELTNDVGYITGIDWGEIGGTLSSQTDLTTYISNQLATQDTLQEITDNGFVTTNPIRVAGLSSVGDIDMLGNSIINVGLSSLSFTDGASIGADGSGNITIPNNVGIGTSSPTSELTISGGIDFVPRSAQNVTQQIYNDASDNLYIGTVSAGKNVYLGDSSGTVVSASGVSAWQLSLQAGGGSAASKVPLTIDAVTSQTADLTQWRNESNVVLNVVDASGNIGIGTDTPVSKLNVIESFPSNDDGQVVATFDRSVDTGGGTVGIGSLLDFRVENAGQTLTTVGQIGAFLGSGPNDGDGFAIRTSGINRLTVTRSGNVGIGNFFPDALLDVSGSAVFDGNVGIGTSSPSQKLDVESSSYTVATFKRTGTGGGVISFKNSSNNEWSFGTQSDGEFAFHDRDNNLQPVKFEAGAPNDSLYLNSSGNVGIGTTTPQSSLDVKGTIYVSEGTELNAADTVIGKYAFWSDDTSTGASLEAGSIKAITTDAWGGTSVTNSARLGFFPVNQRDATSEKMSILPDGNIGIGTTSPSYKLDVNGDAAFNDLITITGSDGNSLTNAGSINLIGADGNLGYMWMGDVGNFAGFMKFGTNPSNQNDFAFAIDSSNNFYSKQTLNFNNTDTTISNTLVSFADITLNDGSGNMLLRPNTDLIISPNNIESLRILQNGNVGIGTSSPSGNLHIYDDTATTGTTKVIIQAGDGNTISDAILDIRNESGTTIAKFRKDGVVSGNILSTTDITTVALNQNLTSGYTLGLNLRDTAGIGWSSNTKWWGVKDVGIYRISAGVIGVGDGSVGDSTGTLVAGNVGIGTSSPSEELDVVGNINVSGDIKTKSLLSTESVGGGSNPAFIFDTPSNLWGNNEPVYDFKKNGTRIFYIDGIGNLTLAGGNFEGNATDPQSGNGVFIGHGMRRSNPAYGMGLYWGESITDDTRAGLDLAPVSGTHQSTGILLRISKDSAKTDVAFQVDADGNVGIGTSSPTYTLDVNGDANIATSLTVGTSLDVGGHFSATTKSFLIDNPNGGKLQYGVTESNEHSVFIRGKTNSSTITLPEEWEWLVDEDSVTVTVTPIGQFQQLYVVSQDNKTIEIGGVEGEYNYIIYGTRKDVELLEVNL